MKDILVNDTYRVCHKLGDGVFGIVHAGTNIWTKEIVAMKLMPRCESGDKILEKEAAIYNIFSGSVGFPQVLWCGRQDAYWILVLQLLGPSLDDLWKYCGRRFSLKTLLLIADQIIPRIEYIHSKGWMHRDIKAGNILLGVGRSGNLLHVIDFGVAKEHGHGEEFWCAWGGDIRFSALNRHRRLESWGDDLESLGYMLIYLSRGSLPWSEAQVSTAKETGKIFEDMKANLPMEIICEGLPEEFITYMNYVRSLGLSDIPNYKYLRGLFSHLFKAEGFKYNNVYDWTEKRFYELRDCFDYKEYPR